MSITRVEGMRLGKREQLLVLEIGGDSIDSASAFVDYIATCYGYSKSSVWYNLNRLKELKLVDFATKDEQGKSLTLTRDGMRELQNLERVGVRIAEFEAEAHMVAPGPDIAAQWDRIQHRNDPLAGLAPGL
jgi:DNA-binding PadR family transcriptional regulator